MSPAERFAADGVLVLPGLIPEADLAAIRASVDRQLRTPPPSINHSRPPGWEAYGTDPVQLGELLAGDPALGALASHPTLARATRDALGPVDDEETLVQVTSGGTGQAWHQDTLPGPEGWQVVNRLVYACEVSAGMGAVVVVPGSHRRGRLPPGGHQEPIPGQLALTPSAGTVVLLSTLCWHRVTPNRSDRPRYSINFRVRPPGVPAGLVKRAVFRNGDYDFAAQRPLSPPG